MVNEHTAPHTLERRAYRTYNITLNNIAASPPRPTMTKSGDPLKKCSSRAHFIQLLEGQIEHSLIEQYPLCLAVVEFDIECDFEDIEPVLYSVAMDCSLNLRPTDIIVRYQMNSLALILHEADGAGGRVAVNRLTRKLPWVFRSGTENVRVTPVFGLSCLITSDSERAEKLLLSAETALMKVRQKRQLVLSKTS
jgi:PleD family two-component response regulator